MMRAKSGDPGLALKVLLLLMTSAMVLIAQAGDVCYAGKLSLNTTLSQCTGTERGSSLRNATFFCTAEPLYCHYNVDVVCAYVYRGISVGTTVTPSPTPSRRPSATPTPSCSASLRNFTDIYCRSECCADLTCPALVRNPSGFVVNLTDHQIVRHGFMNDRFSSYNSSLDGSSGNPYRPRCQCESRGNFLYKDTCITSIGTFPNNRPFQTCSLCYPCYETQFEASLAAGSSSSIAVQQGNQTLFCPQRDGTDPIGCFVGEDLDHICLENFHSGLDVNGDALFCSQNSCNPRSLCNCSYVDFHEECHLLDGKKVFKAFLPVLQRNELVPTNPLRNSDLTPPEVSFDGDMLLVKADRPFSMRLSYKGQSFKLKSQGASVFDVRSLIPPGAFTVNHGASGSVFNFFMEPAETKSHRTLGIVMFSLSLIFPAMILLYLVYKCIPKFGSCVSRTPLFQKIRSSGGSFLDQFLPVKMNFQQATTICIFAGIGLVSCSIEMTNDKMIVGSLESTVVIDDCLSVRQYHIEGFIVLPRKNVDCLIAVTHYNGTSVILEETLKSDSWVDCRIGKPFFENIADTVSCSDSLTDALIVLVVLGLIFLLIVLTPSVLKICAIVVLLAVPVRSCDFSQSITSNAVNCVNTPEGQNCTMTGTFSSFLDLSQTFCVGVKNSFGVPAPGLQISYKNSSEVLQTKISGYTQAFEQSYFSKDRCNDCTFSCNGDCSAEQCQLIGGFGVNPNGQNSDNSKLSCPSFSGCDLIEDSVGESWVSGCLLKPNCHWWQYISCGSGEVSPLSTIFNSRVTSELVLKSSNKTATFRTTDKQPFEFEGFLISTSTQINPVDFKSLDFDVMIRKNSEAYLCKSDGFSESQPEKVGDYFCVEPSCTYRGPESIRIPDDLCTHETLNGDSVFSCHQSFYKNLETQSSCRKLPFTTEAGLIYYHSGQILIDLLQSSQIEVRVSAINSTFSFTSDIIKPDLKVKNCSGFINYSGSSSCHLEGKCTPSGLVSLTTKSSSVILTQDVAFCQDGLDFAFSVFEEDVDFELIVGNFIFNETLDVKFTAQNYTAVINDEEDVKNVDDEGWDPFSSWDKILKGLGNFWDWIIIIVECALILAILALCVYLAVKLVACFLPGLLNNLRKMKLKKEQIKKDPENPPVQKKTGRIQRVYT